LRRRWTRDLDQAVYSKRFVKASDVDGLKGVRSLMPRANSAYYVSPATLARHASGSTPAFTKYLGLAVCLSCLTNAVAGVWHRSQAAAAMASPLNLRVCDFAGFFDPCGCGFLFIFSVISGSTPTDRLLHPDHVPDGIASYPARQDRPARFSLRP